VALHISLVLAILAALAALGLWLPSLGEPFAEAAGETDWPQLQHDPQHTGRTSISVIPGYTAQWVWVDESHVTRGFHSEPSAKISYPSPRTVILAGDVQPIVAENKVFFGAANGQFYALNGSDGSTSWKNQLGGPILHTAAYDGGMIVTGSMDGKIYALRASDGGVRWTYQTDAGISVAPIIVNGVVYVGSRDGHFYAVNLADGTLRWKYRTVAESAGHPHSGAPIMQSAASDGQRIFFGAENMYFYALDASSGAEIWRQKVGGQSFMYSWPVVSNGLVMTFVSVPYGLSEYVLEDELEALPERNTGESRTAYASRVWPQERQVIRDWLAANPEYRNFYVFRAGDGSSPYPEEVPMGRVGGIGYPGRAPVIDTQGRILMYWRTKSAVLLSGGTFGSAYTPDISAMDPATGDRLWLTASSPMGVELDNNFTLTVGGDQLYLNNHMRGAHTIRLANGETVRMTSIMAKWDGADFRGWGNRLIWWGNDSDADTMNVTLPPPSLSRSPQGDCGVVLATINGVPTMFVQESGHYQINFGALAAVQAGP